MFVAASRLAGRIARWCLLVALLANLAHPQDAPPAKGPPPSQQIEIHKIASADLLKLALGTLDRGRASYLAQRREVATLELASDRARKHTDTLPAPIEEPAPEKGPPLEQAKAGLERARVRLEAFKKRLEAITAEKTLGERLVGSVDASSSAAQAFVNLLDDLETFALEVRLRVQDRTLPADAVPASLEKDSLSQQRRELTTEQEQWRQKKETAQKELQATGQRLEAARKKMLEAEAGFTQAGRKYAQEQKHQAYEKEYAGRPLAELLGEVGPLHDEEAGLTGAFNLAVSRFRSREAAVAQRRWELKALTAPQGKEAAPGDDVNAAIAAARVRQKFVAQKVQTLEALHSALQGRSQQAGQLEGEAAVLADHLFRLQVLLGAIAKEAAKENKRPELPKALAPPLVAARLKTVNEAASTALAAIEKDRVELEELKRATREARTAETEVGKRLTDLTQTQEAAQRVLEFEKALRQLAAARVVAELTKSTKALEEKSAALKKQAEIYKRTQEKVAELHKKRQTLQDPFVRLAEAEAQTDRERLLDELKKTAGLDRAPGAGMNSMMSQTPGMVRMPTGMEGPPEIKGNEKGKTRDKGKAEEPAKVDPLSLRGFQQLLATRVQVVEEQAEKDAELKRALVELEKSGETYAAALSAVREAGLRRYAVAVDLKKRLGRGELKAEEVPEEVTQALKREGLAELETTASNLVTAQARTRLEQSQVGRGELGNADLHKLVHAVLALATQRLDLLADLDRLEKESRREKKDRPESETKRIEQSALERQGSEDSWLDDFLGLDASPQARALAEVLQTYYREAIALEEQQGLLAQSKEKAHRLVELAQKEVALLGQARPLLRESVTRLEQQREEETLLAKARLNPETADELLRGYQLKTGKQLARPMPVPDRERAEAVEEAGTALFNRLLQVEAARRWDRLVEARLSSPGLPAELGLYQDRRGALSAAHATNVRRLSALGGKVEPADAAANVTEEPPATTEIARARQELFIVRRDGIGWIIGKILLVLLLAWLLPPVLTSLLERATLRGARADGQVHGKLVVAFLQAFLKLIVYTIALVVVLSILGFDITAILAGLGIGGLAIGLAAQHAISDILGGLIIFLERPFSIGDTVKIGEAEPAQVVGLTWRITRLRDPDGIAINIPNRHVTEAPVVNLTREGKTYDAVPILVPASYSVPEVVRWINQALSECQIPLRGAERAVDVEEMTVSMMMGGYYLRYVASYYITDLTRRDDARCEVLGRVAALLAEKGVIVPPPIG